MCPNILYADRVSRLRTPCEWTMFVTGATGFVGAAVAHAGLAAGCRVVGLARSEAAADRLAATGVEPCRGDLADPDRLADAIAAADVVAHCGFTRDAHDRLDAAVRVETAATHRLAAACARRGARLLYTSGAGVVGPTGPEPVGEDAPLRTPAAMQWRRDLEEVVVDAGGIVVRPAFVYGHAGGYVLRALLAVAVQRRASLYPAPGNHSWPNVHVDDLADLYLRAAAGPAGAIYHAAAGETTPRAVAVAIGRMIGAPQRTVSLPPADAVSRVPYAGWLMGPGIRVDTTKARHVLGWAPRRPGLLDDLEHGSYRQLLADPGFTGEVSR
jgi:nucleoside-diphosphate-sugar epimerase